MDKELFIMDYIPIICFLAQLMLAEFLFFFPFPRRSRFWLRLIVGGVVFAAASLFVPVYVGRYISGVRTFAVLLFALLYLWFCFERSFLDILFCCIGAFSLQNLGNNLQVILCTVIGVPFQMTSWVMLLVFPLLYIIGYFACARPVHRRKHIGVSWLSVLLVAAFCLIVSWLLNAWAIAVGMDQELIVRVPLTFCCILSLFVQFGFLEKSRLDEENAVLEQMLKENEKQYQLSRRTIEVINMKCHDMKHRILELESGASVDREQLEEISQAIDVYDNMAKTGNKVLDIILSEKNLLCERYEIKFSYMVDGEQLMHLSAANIATIFGNALDNAIECVQKIPDKERRIISLIGYARKDVLGIHMENYCEEELEFQDGLPKSTKGDGEQHGFGLKSIEYAVRRYGGNTVVGLEDKIFSLDIIFPLDR